MSGSGKRSIDINKIKRVVLTALVLLLTCALSYSCARRKINLQPIKPASITLGYSNNGRPIIAQRFGQGPRNLIILAGIHGNESTGVLLANALVSSLANQPIKTSSLTILIVPCINPDGLLMQTRVNARGSDINRNFPAANWKAEAANSRYYPGVAPASEPETRAVLELLKMYPPEVLVSIHAPFGCVNWDGPAEKYAAIISAVNRYPLKPDLGYPTPGSLGSYAGVERKIPTITLELRDRDDDVGINLPALRALIDYLCQ